MSRRLAALVVLFVACNVPPPGDPPRPRDPTADRCSDPRYLRAFDPRLRPGPCVSVAQDVIHNRHDNLTARIIRLQTMTRDTTSAISDLDYLARSLANAGDTIGLALPDKLTILLDELEPLPETRAARWPQRIADECTVPYHFASSDPRKLFQVAHEIFHCMQAKQWDDARLDSTDADWWAEGSSELFASMTFPRSGLTDADAAAFNARETTPLASRAHDAVLFFHWFFNTKGAGEVVGLLDGVHDVGGSRARHEMHDAIHLEDWIAFEEAYDDHNIRDLTNRIIPYPDTPAPPVTRIDGSGTRTFNAEPFVVRRATVEFAADKEYQLDRTGQSPKIAMKWSTSRTTWDDPPSTVVTCHDPKRYHAVIGTASSDLTVPVRVTANDAHQCSCLIGAWQQTPDSLARAMPQAGGMANRCTVDGGGTLLELRADHSGADTYQSLHMTCNGPRGAVSTVQTDGALSFTWSTQDNFLLITGGASTAIVHSHVVIHGVPSDSQQQLPAAALRARYECNGNRLHLEYTGTGAPYDYTRVGGGGPRP
jgi:hypothetical protein